MATRSAGLLLSDTRLAAQLVVLMIGPTGARKWDHTPQTPACISIIKIRIQVQPGHTTNNVDGVNIRVVKDWVIPYVWVQQGRHLKELLAAIHHVRPTNG